MDTTTVRKTYKYKLKPTPDQEQVMEFVLRRCRELYNAGLEERKTAWEKCGIRISLASQSAQLPAIKEVRPEESYSQHGEHLCEVSVAGRRLLAHEMTCVRCASPCDDLGGSLLAAYPKIAHQWQQRTGRRAYSRLSHSPANCTACCRN